MSGSTRRTRTLHAAFRDPQRYAETVACRREGFGVGYHLFDAATGTLIVDGRACIPSRT